MKVNNRIFLVIVMTSLMGMLGCRKDATTSIVVPEAEVSIAFESGSMGKVVKLSETSWEFELANDNGNDQLPDTWRNWWYVKMNNIQPYIPIEITLSNRGWPYYYLPVYSYDQIHWSRFAENEVSQNAGNDLVITKQFKNKDVWMARFYPYTFTDLEAYMDSVQDNAMVDRQTIGFSQDGKPIDVLKITNAEIPVTYKKRVLLHARTHPGETPPSFLIEGMINFLLSGSHEVSVLLKQFEFYIFPMQNVDGVTVGNYRTTPKSQNLEVMWYYQNLNHIDLTSEAPLEVSVIHSFATRLMTDGGPPISMAFNLHASNSEPKIRPFFYPHFGTESQGYSAREAALWNKQLRFIDCLANHYGTDKLEPKPSEGGSSFASKTYPESWWWVNFHDQVMAMTFEMTYGQAGYAPHWITPDNLRQLGADMVLAIRDFEDPDFVITPSRKGQAERKTHLKYPELYPPDFEDESKR